MLGYADRQSPEKLSPGKDEENHLSSKLENQSMAAKQRLRLVSPCGGGWGDPLKRDPKRVRADILDDLVSVELARDKYGVSLIEDLEVDETETEQLRDERRGGTAFLTPSAQLFSF